MDRRRQLLRPPSVSSRSRPRCRLAREHPGQSSQHPGGAEPGQAPPPPRPQSNQRPAASLEIGTLGGYPAPSGSPAPFPLRANSSRSNTIRPTPQSPAKTSSMPASARIVDIRIGSRSRHAPATHPARFDLIFIDADKPSMPDYLHLVAQTLRPGTLIVADNVVRRGAVLDEHPRGRHHPGRPLAHRHDRQRKTRLRHRPADCQRQRLRDGFILARVLSSPIPRSSVQMPVGNPSMLVLFFL